MKNNTTFKKGLIGLTFIFLAIVAGNLKAQVTNSNVIAPVNVSSNDGFNELRNLLIAQFDFTNPDMQQGEVSSLLKFSVADNGQVIGVEAEGGCKYVQKELEEVLSRLQYRLDLDKIRADTSLTSFVMPVKVTIASR